VSWLTTVNRRAAIIRYLLAVPDRRMPLFD